MSEIATHVQKLLEQRYFKTQDDNSWEKLSNRVSNHVMQGETEQKIQQVKSDLVNRVWLPNSPCLANAGTNQGGLFACFVAGPTEDTLENHADTLKEIALVAKHGGGCGFTGTHIRQEGAPVAGSSHGYAYGPNNWAIRVNDYMSMLTQGGFRKMALMYTLHSEHPDLDSFINLKQTTNENHGALFNQSIMATNDFMFNAMVEGSKESQLLDKIVESAWNNGEPGLLFFDKINQSPYSKIGEVIHGTNPCGEQPLPPYGSCNLAAINLFHDTLYQNDDFNYVELERVVRTMVRFLDNVGTVNRFPDYQFAKWYKEHRPIGIGVMGYADALLKLGLVYGSEESLRFLRKVMSTIYYTAKSESEKLGVEKGVPKKCDIFNRRNITLTTVAPTGSRAFIAETSHGIEPIFSPYFEREDERGEKYTFKHPMANEEHFRSSINKDFNKVPSVESHIKVQASAQEFVDSGVSKTVNMSPDSTVEDVRDAMMQAFLMDCKGITIYRTGSRLKEVLTDKDAEEQDCVNGVCEI